MQTLVNLRFSEDGFAALEACVEKIRVWLDAGRGTQDGRGERIIGRVETLNLCLEVQRDDG